MSNYIESYLTGKCKSSREEINQIYVLLKLSDFDHWLIKMDRGNRKLEGSWHLPTVILGTPIKIELYQHHHQPHH